MARYSAGVLTGAGSTTLPVISLYSAAAVTGIITEIGLFNTTATAVAVKLVRLTTTGTQGTGLTEAANRPNAPAASCAAFTTHTGAPTLGADLGYRASLGAAVGSGVVWTPNLETLVGTANGIGVIVENGTGQALQAYIKWEE